MQGGAFLGNGGVKPSDWEGASYVGGVSAYSGKHVGGYGEFYGSYAPDSNGKAIYGFGLGGGLGSRGINAYLGPQTAIPFDESNPLVQGWQKYLSSED